MILLIILSTLSLVDAKIGNTIPGIRTNFVQNKHVFELQKHRLNSPEIMELKRNAIVITKLNSFNEFLPDILGNIISEIEQLEGNLNDVFALYNEDYNCLLINSTTFTKKKPIHFRFDVSWIRFDWISRK